MNRQYDHLSQKAYAAFQKRWWIGVPALLLAACLGYLLSQRPSLSEAAAIPAASLGLHQHGILRPCIPTTRDNASDTVEAAGALKDTAEPYVRVPALGAQHVLPLRAATQYEDVLQRLAAYEAALSARQLKRGRIYDGDQSRLRRTVNKAVHGFPISVCVLGGSITAGQGSATGPPVIARVFDWVRTTFPVTQPNVERLPNGTEVEHREHQLVNSAIAGTKSDWAASLLTSLVQRNVELVLLDFSSSDHWENEPWATNAERKRFERLIRTLLNYPERPAVVLLDCYAWIPQDGRFWVTPEDGFGVLAQFYGLPWLSQRGATYHEMRAGLDGYKPLKHDDVPADQDGITMYWDPIHPHGKTGHRYLAELVMGLVTEAAIGLLAEPYSATDEDSVSARIPDPMLENNWERAGEVCVAYDVLKHLAINPVGFEWVNEHKHGQENPGKWGWIAKEPGSSMKIQLSSLRPPGVAPGVKVAVEIGHLRSYEHMGHARITCEGGCGCEPTILDGTWEHRYSLTDMAELEVRDVGEGCVLRFEVLPETSSPDGEHKVKITALIIREDDAAAGAAEAGDKKSSIANTNCRNLDHLAKVEPH